MAVQDDLLKQILGQNLTSKWSGGHSPQDAARDMAKLMADAGITDIKQFGKIPVYEKAESKLGFQGQIARQDEDGNYYIMAPGGVDSEGFPYNSRQNVDASQLKPIYGKTITTPEGETSTSYFEPIDPSQLVLKDGVPTYKARDDFGNKETGQTIKRGSGRWEGQGGDNLFSGTGSGKGNTGFRVNFTDDGTPVFYTTGASSSDLKDYAPLLAIAGLAFGAPMLGDLLAGAGAGAGATLGLTAAEAAGLGLTAAEAAAAGLSASEFAAALGTAGAGASAGGAGLLESVFDPTFGGELSSVIGGGAESVFDPTFGGTLTTEGLPALDAGMGTYPSTGTIGNAAATAAKFPLSVSDTIRLAGIGATLAGGAKLVGDAGGSGSGGFPIVPIPADWTSPPPTSTAAFAPLPDIDFGNKEMLRGTQWERLLNPNYGNVPAPTQYAQPSNMSYDELTRILGGSRTSVPTQNLTINDVIAGIQSQYGQTPQGSMG